MSQPTENPNAALIAGLRELTAFIEANVDFDFTQGRSNNIVVELHYRTWYGNPDTVKERLADLARRMGSATKSYGKDFAWVRRSFGPHVELEISTTRNAICERVQVGTKVVPETVLPARPETVIPAREVPLYEWRCGSILAEPESEVAA